MFAQSSICLRLLFCISVLIPFVACTELYPRFDSFLNLDIREVRAGEVVDNVKCAVAAFLEERASKVEARVKLATQEEARMVADCRQPGKWRIRYFKQSPDGTKCLKTNNMNEADQGNVCVPNYEIYKYVRRIRKKNDGRATGASDWTCVPNGGCRPGWIRGAAGNCLLDDDSRFALDPSSTAKIELTLLANNTGSMNYQKIDASDWGVLNNIIVAGNSGKGFPFPTLLSKAKLTNTVNLNLVMSQAQPSYEEDYRKDDYIVGELEKLEKLGTRKELTLSDKERGRPDNTEILAQYTSQALEALRADYKNEYLEKCSARKMDFLGLKNYLTKIVDEREKEIYAGPPEVTLDNLALTTGFQITVDATAGTQHLLRIVPVFQPPVLSLSPDHTHTLKLTFAGVKSRGLSRSAASLKQKCITRLQIIADAQKQCEEPSMLLLESIIDAIESNKGSVSGG